jgi:hypothetical protein
MLLSLVGAPNPTQHLMAAIQGRSITKDEDFYIALIDGANRSVVKLMSGDPSRGALGLDTEDSLRTGQRVQVGPSRAR